MLIKRTCAAVTGQGKPCRQAPLLDGEFCFWHDPEHAQEAAEARRLGGLRRRRERTVSGAYDLEGLESVPQFGDKLRCTLGALSNGVVVGIAGQVRQADQLAQDRKSTRLNSSHIQKSRMPSSA